MNKILLKFESIQQVVGAEDMAVIIMTDPNRQKALSVVCDVDMMRQLQMRLKGPRDLKRTLLPEVLSRMLDSTYELLVLSIYNGQYQVLLMDMNSGHTERVRMSDAVLLSIISKIPLYIEESLMKQQCFTFDESSEGVSIPINVMDVPKLKLALDHAVEVEDYELASQIRDEIKRRKQ